MINSRPSPLALTVLSLLSAGPLHPYGMQRLIRLWGKDQVVNVGERANLYRTIRRLHSAGLIAVRQTERDQSFPERTVYELTDEGRRTGGLWLADILSVPRNEFPEFPAALSFLMLLGPEGALPVLDSRAAALRESLATLDRSLLTEPASLPRVTTLETEYQRAMVAAELTWVTALVADLRSGGLSWTREDFNGVAGLFAPD